MDMKRIFLYAILIAAMALAGCGGNGGGGTGGSETLTPEQMDLAAIRTALNLADDADRQAILDAIMALNPEDPVIAELRTALGLASDATATMVLSHVMGLVGVNTDLGAVRTALSLPDDADRQAILDAITALADANPEDPVIADLRTALNMPNADAAMILATVMDLVAEDMRTEDAVAAKKAPAIADPDGDGTLNENDATSRGTVAGSDETVATAPDDLENPNRPGKGAANDGSEDLFSLSGGGIDMPNIMTIGPTAAADRLGMPDGTVDDDNEFVGTAGTPVDGFAVNVHTRTINDVMDTVTVFDNRDDPADVEYGTFYSEAAAGDRDAVTSADAAGVLTIDINDVDGNHDLFYSSEFPMGEDQTYTHVDADSNADPPVLEQRGGQTFDGMFNGVPGEYACTGTCTSGTDSMGNLDTLTGTWTFTPEEVEEDADPHMITGANYDQDYLAFGYWLQGTGTGDALKYGIGTFATGSMPFAGANAATAVAALMGSATYSGPAAGMFVMKTDIDDDNMGPVSTEAGKFTADATLEAKFGDDTMSPDDFTISGRVENFVLENYDGSSVDNSWELSLNSAEFATRTYSTSTGMVDSITAHQRTFGGSTGSMETGLGRWEGQFYGQQVEDNAETATTNEAETGYPTGVAGEFIGHFENGHAIGAFGAPKVP